MNRADERKGRRKRLALAGRRFRVRDFRIPKKKTDVSIGGAERPRWSTMASNRIYIPGEPVFTPANHPRFRPRYEGD